MFVASKVALAPVQSDSLKASSRQPFLTTKDSMSSLYLEFLRAFKGFKVKVEKLTGLEEDFKRRGSQSPIKKIEKSTLNYGAIS